MDRHLEEQYEDRYMEAPEWDDPGVEWDYEPNPYDGTYSEE